MGKATKYVSKQADENGFIHWSEEENQTWQALIERQLACVQGKACDEYMHGLEKLNLPTDRIPQLSEVNQVLTRGNWLAMCTSACANWLW